MDVPGRSHKNCFHIIVRSFRPRPVGGLRRRLHARRMFYLLVAMLVTVGGILVPLSLAKASLLSGAGVGLGLLVLLVAYYRKSTRFRALDLCWPTVPGLWHYPPQ